MSASAWLAEDGKHVMFKHDCPYYGSEPQMMPYPKWHAAGGMVEPSFACQKCGFHQILALSITQGEASEGER